jgi:hypothetical protein
VVFHLRATNKVRLTVWNEELNLRIAESQRETGSSRL